MGRKIITKAGTEICRLRMTRCNIIFVSRSDKTIMVDTGMPSDRFYVRRAIDKKGRKPLAVILTHTHFDHAANAAWIKRICNPDIIVQAAEADHLSGGDTPIPEGTLQFTRWLVSAGRHLNSWFTYEPCNPDIVMSDHYDLSIYGINGRIIHTPGHCPGEVAVIIDDEVVICGDNIVGLITGRVFPPFADDETELIRSWKRLLDTGCSLFVPGHGKPVTREILEKEYYKRSGD